MRFQFGLCRITAIRLQANKYDYIIVVYSFTDLIDSIYTMEIKNVCDTWDSTYFNLQHVFNTGKYVSWHYLKSITIAGLIISTATLKTYVN